ncbi:nose resistant to fluoxetine protein 6 [Caerostris extrusa]|uniref:Nose resistant to fluoxetine protein 6 n=1 Tax=Caerostris extrusa TaxID=172846 RepID=A0AAV4S1U9_CAEEX|nr:nose resistant to fluoxetine protein 6 [Caerostris extrusa]
MCFHPPDAYNTELNLLAQLVQFQLPLEHLPIKTGLCLPETCSTLNIKQDIRHIVNLLHRLPFLKEYTEFLSLNSLNCEDSSPGLSSSAVIFLYILGAYFTLVAFGSCLTAIEYIKMCLTNSSKDTKIVTQKHPSVFSDFVSEKTLQTHLLHTESFIDEQASGKNISALYFRMVLSKEVTKELKIFEVFLLVHKRFQDFRHQHHSEEFPVYPWHQISEHGMGNYVDLLHSIDNLPFQIVIQGTFSVDSFFLIRLTPVYMLLIVFNTLMFKNTGSGPFWGDDSDIDACKQHWWWNLLYINNFLPLESMCTTWTWYLANDMQFFLMGVILLSIVWRWPSIGLSISGIFLVSSWIVTWCISYYYKLSPLFVGISSATDYETYKDQ